jgi:predicted nucleic acid-binding protein
MILVDTSVWIAVLKDKTGRVVQAFKERTGDDLCALTRFTQLELLQGAKNEAEWRQLDAYLSTQYYLEASAGTWREAARIYFDLRRRGVTVNSPIDCCIGELAIEFKALLLHRDRDFERIVKVRPLHVEWFPAGR